ncbi:hypothetical protein NEDG_01790 [Nematocida displodere]|uniref:DUF4203 domain-containing protein n=1 Tax=Nematocida displodere TaxID=1805483 RepID=A0A177EJK0_9MICR|nr:hypothetical protein NEDG_01790 [Nematocida displodere]
MVRLFWTRLSMALGVTYGASGLVRGAEMNAEEIEGSSSQGRGSTGGQGDVRGGFRAGFRAGGPERGSVFGLVGGARMARGSFLNENQGGGSDSSGMYTLGGLLRSIESFAKWIYRATVPQTIPFGIDSFGTISPATTNDPSNAFVLSSFMLFTLFLLGSGMVICGERFRVLHLSVVVFIYGFSGIFANVKKIGGMLLLPEKDFCTGLCLGEEELFRGYLVLSGGLCFLAGYLVSLALKVFFKTLMVSLCLLFFVYGPGGTIVGEVGIQNSLIVLGVLLFGYFFLLSVIQKKVEIYLHRIFFGFFGSLLLCFSIMEYQGEPSFVPRVLLNYRASECLSRPLDIQTLVFLVGGALFSVYMQSKSCSPSHMA